MTLVLFPFKLLGVPSKAFFGLFGLELIGVILAAVVNAWVCRMGVCWAAWNFGWNISMMTINVVTLIGFVLTFPATGKK